MSLEHELKVVKYAVCKAAEAVMQIARDGFKADRKADNSPITAADLEANRILHETLIGDFGDYGWLSEETRDDPHRLECDRVWIVDPVDGTREFTMQIPEFAISVALAERGEVILGVICNPATGELFEAVSGGGTKLNGRPVRSDHNLDGKPVVEVSRSDIEKGRFAEFESVLELRPCGSIAYKLARLAAGKADSTLSVTPKNEWDIAAGVLLVTEAGGIVTDLTGRAYEFNQKDTLVNGVIAATSNAYDSLRKTVDSANK